MYLTLWIQMPFHRQINSNQFFVSSTPCPYLSKLSSRIICLIILNWIAYWHLEVSVSKTDSWFVSHRNALHAICLSAKSHQSCLTLCSPTACSPPGSSVQGDSPGVGCMPSSRGSYWCRNWTHICYIPCTGRWVLYHSHHNIYLQSSSPQKNVHNSYFWAKNLLCLGLGQIH